MDTMSPKGLLDILCFGASLRAHEMAGRVQFILDLRRDIALLEIKAPKGGFCSDEVEPLWITQ